MQESVEHSQFRDCVWLQPLVPEPGSEVFGYIGQGYVYNPEFKENIDKFGKGTAQHTSDVIAHMLELRQNKNRQVISADFLH